MKRFNIRTPDELELFVELAKKHGGQVNVYHPSFSNAALKNSKLVPDNIDIASDPKLAHGMVKQKDMSKAMEGALRSTTWNEGGWCVAVIAVAQDSEPERPHAHIALAEFGKPSRFGEIWKEKNGRVFKNAWRDDRHETMELGDGLSESEYIAQKHKVRNTSRVYAPRMANPPEDFIRFYDSLCESFETNT